VATPDQYPDIPENLLPYEGQVPVYVQTDEQRQRFNLCFAIGRLICQRDDPIFVRQLYLDEDGLPTMSEATDQHREPHRRA